MADPAVFPFVSQSEYVDIPEAPLPGDIWEGELFNKRPHRGLIAKVTEVSQITEVQIGANNPTDTVGVYIDGALVIVTAGANADATALLLEAAIEAVPAFADILDSVTTATDTVTINFSDSEVHTVVEYSPDATTATPTTTQAAVGQEKLLYGFGVVKKLPVTTANFTSIRKPTAVSDVFAGVLVRTHGTNLPPEQIRELGFDPDFLCPGQAYTVMADDVGVVVEYVDTAPVVGDPVYLICTGTDAGKWRVDDGGTPGTSEVVTLTLTSVADGNIGFNYDGLPSIFIAATGNATNDAASLYNLYLGNAAYAAITTSIVDNLDGTLTITFNDDVTHTFTDDSTGTSTVAEAVGTPAVAAIPATSKLIEHYSWGRPSVTNGDPTRAFLRLSNP